MKFLALFVSLFSSVAALACPSDSVCPRDRVVVPSGQTGTVLEVFQNGQARVGVDGVGYILFATANLGKSVQCFEQICAGDRAINLSGRAGKVMEVFSNGQARVGVDGVGYITFATANLGKGVQCHEQFCVGDRVLTPLAGRGGKIMEVFSNGQAIVGVDQTGYITYSTSSLSK